jgi:hypothetical protein
MPVLDGKPSNQRTLLTPEVGAWPHQYLKNTRASVQVRLG